MSKFKHDDFKIHSEVAKSSGDKINIVKLEGGTPPVVRSFEFQNLRKLSEGDYAAVKAKFGPLAVTDNERTERRQKDRRFSLNPLLRDPLSVEQEEQRVFDQKVQTKIDSLTEEAKTHATADGYAVGLKQGHDEAYQKMMTENAGNFEKFSQIVNEAEHAKTEIFQANERFIMEMIFKISKMVLLKELSVDRDHLLRLAKELLQRVDAKEHITIKINPEDVESIPSLKEGIQKSNEDLKNLHIELSSQVKRGGIKVETEWSAIETHIDTQLQGIYESLFGKSTSQEMGDA